MPGWLDTWRRSPRGGAGACFHGGHALGVRLKSGSEQERRLAFPPPASLFSLGCAHRLVGMTCIPVAVLSLSRNCIIPKGTETGSYSARHPWMPWHPQGAREQWQYGSELNLEPLLPHQVRYSCEWEAARWVRPLPTVPGHPRDHLADDIAVACKRNFPWICTCLSNPTRKAGASWRRGESVCMQRTNSTLSPSN